MDFNYGHCTWMSMDIHVLLNGIMVRVPGLSKHGLVHGLCKLSMDLTMASIHGWPWISVFLLNGTMIRDNGL